LEFNSEKVGSATHPQLKLQEATRSPCPARVCGIIRQQMFATGISKTEFVIFG